MQLSPSTTKHKRAARLGRSLACLLVLLLAACGSSRQVEPEPEPQPEPALIDRSSDLAYRLDAVEEKLKQSEMFERRGRRAAAAAIVETAQLMLPEGHEREHTYLEVVKAAVWARDVGDLPEAEPRDPEAALEILEPAERWAIEAGDGYLYADAMLVYVQLQIAASKPREAASAATRALESLENAQAWSRLVEVARWLVFAFSDAGEHAAARMYAGRGYGAAQNLKDDLLLTRICLAAASDRLASGGSFEPWYERAYEASVRYGSEGWRQVVIAQAVAAFFETGDMASCTRWGDRIRDRVLGRLPALADTLLRENDYIMLMVHYTVAMFETDPDSPKVEEARGHALAAIESLPESLRAEWAELEENLRGEALNPDEEK